MVVEMELPEVSPIPEDLLRKYVRIEWGGFFILLFKDPIQDMPFPEFLEQEPCPDRIQGDVLGDTHDLLHGRFVHQIIGVNSCDCEEIRFLLDIFLYPCGRVPVGDRWALRERGADCGVSIGIDDCHSPIPWDRGGQIPMPSPADQIYPERLGRLIDERSESELIEELDPILNPLPRKDHIRIRPLDIKKYLYDMLDLPHHRIPRSVLALPDPSSFSYPDHDGSWPRGE